MTTTIDTRTIGEYLDAPDGLDTPYSWIVQGSRGRWHSDTACWQFSGRVEAPMRKLTATLREGSGKICFTCGTKLMQLAPEDTLRDGWAAALLLEHAYMELAGASQDLTPESLGANLVLARNVLASVNEIHDNAKRCVSVKLPMVKQAATSLLQDTAQQLGTIQDEIARQAAVDYLDPALAADTHLQDGDLKVFGNKKALTPQGLLTFAYHEWRHSVLGGMPAEACVKAACAVVHEHQLTHLSQLEGVPASAGKQKRNALDSARAQWVTDAKSRIRRLATRWNEAYKARICNSGLVYMGVTNPRDIVEPVGLMTAAMGAWPLFEDSDSTKAIVVLPRLIAETAQLASLPWGIDVEIVDAEPESQQADELARTTLVLWEPSQTQSLYSELGAAVEAARRL